MGSRLLHSSSSYSVTMKSFVAVLACVSMANAGVIAPVGYAGHLGYAGAYGAVGYAGHPVAAGYAAAPVAAYGGVYAGSYDPSVAYANLYPAAEPYNKPTWPPHLWCTMLTTP